MQRARKAGGIHLNHSGSEIHDGRLLIPPALYGTQMVDYRQSDLSACVDVHRPRLSQRDIYGLDDGVLCSRYRTQCYEWIPSSFEIS